MVWSIISLLVIFVHALMCLYFIQDPFRPLHSQYGCWSHGWQDGWDWSRAAGVSPSWLDHLQELVQTWGRLCHTRTLCYGGSGSLLGYSTCWSLCMCNVGIWAPTNWLKTALYLYWVLCWLSGCNEFDGLKHGQLPQRVSLVGSLPGSQHKQFAVTNACSF